MEEIQKSKLEVRSDIAKVLAKLSQDEIAAIEEKIEERLFDFANFLESKIALLYISHANEVNSDNIIKKSFDYNKIVVLPANAASAKDLTLYKIDDYHKDLTTGPDGTVMPDKSRCKAVPIDCIDIAVIPGVAFDEKGSRLGAGDGYYDLLIPKLPITTRKVSLAYDQQILAQVPTESHDKPVDIIITDKRIIYKI